MLVVDSFVNGRALLFVVHRRFLGIMRIAEGGRARQSITLSDNAFPAFLCLPLALGLLFSNPILFQLLCCRSTLSRRDKMYNMRGMLHTDLVPVEGDEMTEDVFSFCKNKNKSLDPKRNRW